MVQCNLLLRYTDEQVASRTPLHLKLEVFWSKVAAKNCCEVYL